MSRPFVSASRRTDIPAWYTPWFMQRIRAGRCRVANPFRPSQVTTVSLDPADVQAIFFWTRYPLRILPHLDELESRGHRFVFHFTVTGLPEPLERHPEPLEARIEAARRLAGLVGPDRVWWRYDPIILGARLTPELHVRTFERLAGALAGATRRVTLSLLDWYRKTERNLGSLERETGPLHRVEATAPEVLSLVSSLAAIARTEGITPVSCCEPAWQQAGPAVGLEPGACIDAAAANRIFGLSVPQARDPGQRPSCLCAPSFDIGAVDTCIGGCAYCYSTRSAEAAERTFAGHDPDMERLAPSPRPARVS